MLAKALLFWLHYEAGHDLYDVTSDQRGKNITF